MCHSREFSPRETNTHTHAEEHVRLTFIFLFLHIEEHTIHFHEIKIFVRILIQFDIQYFLEMRELYIFVIHYDSDTMNNKKNQKIQISSGRKSKRAKKAQRIWALLFQ